MILQKKATIISSITAFFLAFIKLIIWIISGSVAVLSSAIDSLLDMFVSLFNLFAVSNAEKTPDKKFNYGKWKTEALASFLEWIIISLSGIYIFYESIKKIIFKEEISDLNISLFVMIISVFITFFLVSFLSYVWKKTNNLVIKADSLHYKTDLFTNIWILIWLFIIKFTWFYIIDSIIWIIISFYIIFEAFKIIKEWYLLLLDASLEKEEVDKILEIIKKYKEIKSYHFLKTRKSWKYKFVEVHLVFNPEILLLKAHHIWDLVEDDIKKLDKNFNWEITIHLDPYDDSKKNKENIF